MIEEEYRNRCKAMFDKETAESYLVLIGTSDDRTGLDFFGSIKDLANMLANAAMNEPVFRIALKFAVSSLEEYNRTDVKTEAKC